MKKDNSVSFTQSTLLPWIELRIANQSSACYEAHSHDEFSFGIIDSGVADYRNRHNLYRIGQGDIVTINPFDVHSCNPELHAANADHPDSHHSDLQAWSYRMLFVDTLKMGEVQQDVLQNQHSHYTPFLNDLERSPNLQQQFIALFSALRTGNSILEAEVCLFDFVEACFAHHPTKIIQTNPLQPNLVRVRQKLLDDVGHSHQLQSLAEEAGISRYQLVRAFKSQFGLPPHAYLIDDRIKRAKRMLKSGQSISEIALQLGFSDQAHFQRQFKRKLAVTPKFYQSHFVNRS